MVNYLFFVLLIATSSLALPFNHIIAVVNDGIVLESELSMLEGTLNSYPGMEDDAVSSTDSMHKNRLERLIMRKIVVQEAIKANIHVSDSDLIAVVRRMADDNKLSVREFVDSVDEGKYTFADLLAWVREEIFMKRFNEMQEYAHVIISEREINYLLATQYTRSRLRSLHHLLHISIYTSKLTAPEISMVLHKKLDKIQGLLNANINFSEVAAAYSESSNASNGGDLGWRKYGNVPSIFAKIVRKLTVGQVSNGIFEDNSLHLVKLKERKIEALDILKSKLASHISIKVTQLTTDKDVKARLQKLRKNIIDGDDFAKLARINSNDINLAIKGGNLGWIIDGTVVPGIGKIIDTLDKGMVSEVFENHYGWHIVKVFDEAEKSVGEKYMRNKARYQIEKRKRIEDRKYWLTFIHDKAYIEYRDY